MKKTQKKTTEQLNNADFNEVTGGASSSQGKNKENPKPKLVEVNGVMMEIVGYRKDGTPMYSTVDTAPPKELHLGDPPLHPVVDTE